MDLTQIVPPTSAAERDPLTTKDFWDRTWHSERARGGRDRRLRRLVRLDWQLADILTDSVDRVRAAGRRPRVLEVGCGNSYWLPFLAEQTGCDVLGVDYSEQGCELAERNLQALGVRGSIVCADFFEYVRRRPEPVDLILSFGVVEHFPDVADVLATMASMVRPGGVVFASVPNLGGIYGRIQRVVDRRVLEQHLVLSAEDLARYAQAAGLTEVESGYVGGPLRLGILNSSHLPWMPRVLSRAIARGSFVVDYAAARIWHRLRRRAAGAGSAAFAFTRGVSKAGADARRR